ncbi:cytochrome-c peroxidase [Formosa sp. PL04]|uniref:cytochrome-c peroxidase n=1 Tax=Formosa sp. PL04 TaxID=3081755 RepID=UPI00298198B1|nr:cytochrome c peroxidase [Formosa sp. PL04]MDW5290870.1 cytochrome c peroxidase [Formosa sp. PL04]
MNNILFMKAKAYTFGICLLLLITVSCKKEEKTVNIDSTEKNIETFYISELNSSISFLDSISIFKKTEDNIAFYKKARMHFKTVEPILASIDKNNFKSLNAPNILQVQEEDLTDIKIRNPFGFQVIEEMLHESEIDTLNLENTVSITSNRLKLIKANTSIKLKDYHIIWLIRDQIIRIATTGITGFDSPVLGQSLAECQYTYKTLITLIEFYKDKYTSKEIYNNLIASFKNSIENLNHDFDSFDRYDFIKNYTDKQLELLVKTQEDWHVTFPFEMAISNNATSLFGANTVNVFYFTDYKSDTTNLKQKEAFGKLLFNDKMLSKNYNMACASCHIEDKAFTDGRKTFDKNQLRNSPTLTYAAYQQSFFMDGRAGSLEGQVVGVAENHDEFNLPMDSIANRVVKNPNYKQLVDKLYNNKRVDFNTRHAIASYVRTLNGFNSKFDNNINGKENSLTDEEKHGFNLFMGKAVCATCHFPPLFNGTVPPNYNDTEVELIGVPQNNDTINAIISTDLGSYNVFGTNERKHFFKTPTVRNIEKTAPYMHNGVYTTLEEVVDFYNRGGGKGIGIHEDYQTLPFDELNLTKAEQESLIAFMKTLSDTE